MDDLVVSGLFDEMIVFWMGEFGWILIINV